MSETQLDPQQQLQLCRQVARLVRAKLPLVGELTQATAGQSPMLEASARSVEDKIAKGNSLAGALAGDSSRNSRMLAACIEAGERSQALARTLEDWAGMHIANSKSSKAMRAAMIYPSLLILVTLLSLGFVIWRLIPEYRATYVMFSQEMPAWLGFIVQVREHMAPLIVVLAVLAVLPMLIWFWRRCSYDKHNLPREPATRQRLQALVSNLAGYLIAAHVPLNEVVALTTRAMVATDQDTEQAFERLKTQQPVQPLPHETSMLLASLHAGLIQPGEAAGHLHAVADHLRQSADVVASRNARWLPMLIALVVGALTILTYVFLIYMPWIALLHKIVTPDYLSPIDY